MLVSYRPLAAVRGAGALEAARPGGEAGCELRHGIEEVRSYSRGRRRRLGRRIANWRMESHAHTGSLGATTGGSSASSAAPFLHRRSAPNEPTTAASAASAKKRHATGYLQSPVPISQRPNSAVQMMATTAFTMAHACTQTRQPRWLLGAASCVVHEQHPCAK